MKWKATKKSFRQLAGAYVEMGFYEGIKLEEKEVAGFCVAILLPRGRS